MQNARRLFHTLNSEKAVVYSSFIFGFTYNFKFNKKTLENPMSTLFNSTVDGFLYSVAGVIIGDLMPPQIRFVIPMLVTSSCVYYKYKDLNVQVEQNEKVVTEVISSEITLDIIKNNPEKL